MDSANVPSREAIYAALVDRQGAENVAKLQKATVAVCGLGGLGSNVAIALARAGVGRLILIDFDRVDITNLHRQQYKASQVGELKAEAMPANLKEIAPYVELVPHVAKITPENFESLVGEAQYVVEAFDKPEAKAMLVNAVLERNGELAASGKAELQQYLVSASGMAGFDTANTIKTRRVSKRFFMCGDEVSDVNKGIGLVAPRVMACAAHEAHLVVRLILGLE